MPTKFSSNTKGIIFIVSAIFCLSLMDGFTRYLTDYYNVITINMFRYFFLFLFVISINSIGNKSVIIVSKSKYKIIQIIRGTVLAVEMCFAHYLFLKIGNPCYFCKLSPYCGGFISIFFGRKSWMEKMVCNSSRIFGDLDYAKTRF